MPEVLQHRRCMAVPLHSLTYRSWTLKNLFFHHSQLNLGKTAEGGDFWARQPKGGAFEFSSQKGVGSHIDPLDALCQASPASLIDPGAFW